VFRAEMVSAMGCTEPAAAALAGAAAGNPNPRGIIITEEKNMAAEVALTIRKNFERAETSLLHQFEGVFTGNVCDAQNRTGALDERIKPVSRLSQFCGSR